MHMSSHPKWLNKLIQSYVHVVHGYNHITDFHTYTKALYLAPFQAIPIAMDHGPHHSDIITLRPF